ncbi:hypothetical protein NCLIV_010200 [Neospora caninum Liverpool]|uniref:60S ribosomal protein L5 n=1 Tax=Neospora caninum (strain Liverpool) TaxID=572307 RepID=F0VA62_NEOCL|nr:hypothetical protein NCLIV_010200 [Neospora caninum Liverpool]CBZ50551.1 hypothetical protein NCLIV_010200 [Neospora caninum Liverpool]CEL65161.1 TPA: 60S ribosomal protein L5 [Neospora caninum Liverpool]|eukprot:XP_003880584.1 hypothetical protein NCLIV_010200 [Neospora caninum Liverpool]
MAFVKALKNKAYFKRYQVKYRRRRQGKTDYAARRALVLQDRNKYNAHKHRLVVRLTNKRIICQVVYSTIEGDRILASAESTELPRYGVKIGLTNYAAAYCTGLLLARRVLKHLGMSEAFEGVEATGEEFHIEENFGERRPFKVLLDVGIVRTTVGNRVFGAMKGAADGGLHVPHGIKKFPGYSKPEGEGEGSYDPEAHRARILGLHVADYMRQLKEEDPEKYSAQFAQYIKNKIEADDIEAMYKNAHAQIRKNPDPVKKERAANAQNVRQGNVIKTAKGQYVRNVKLTKAQRRERVQQKIAMIAEQMAAEA